MRNDTHENMGKTIPNGRDTMTTNTDAPEINFRKIETKFFGKSMVSILVLLILIFLPLLILDVMAYTWRVPLDWLLATFALFLIPCILIGNKYARYGSDRYPRSGSPMDRDLKYLGFGLAILYYFPIGPRLMIESQNAFLCMLAFLPFFIALVIDIKVLHPMLSYFRESFRVKRSLTGPLDYLKTAAKDTDEFMDGYSPRPVDTEVAIQNISRLREYARMMMYYALIFDYEEAPGGSLKLYFYHGNPGPGVILSGLFNKPGSYLLISENGEVTVTLSQSTYDILEAPVSYHRLCGNIAERIRASYEYFIMGYNDAALHVFAVEKGGKGASQ